MVWRIPSPTTDAGANISLAADEDIFVAEQVMLQSIFGSGGGHEARIYGTVVRDGDTVWFTGGSGNKVLVGPSGHVEALSTTGQTALAIWGFDATVVNQGYVWAGYLGVYLNGVSATTASTILNTGTLHSENIAVARDPGTTERIVLTNQGTISGRNFAYGVFLGTAENVDWITNSGTIIGTIDLAGGNDLLDSRTGQLLGTVTAGAGNDTVLGGAAFESIFGDAGNDRLNGGAGDDLLDGGSGADLLIGGRGADDIYMGSADGVRDRARYTSLLDSGRAATTRDEVFQFVRRQDKIDLSAIDANPSLGGNQAFTVVTSFTSALGEVRLLRSGADTIVQVDGDRDLAVDMSIRVVGVHLTSADLIL